MKRKIVLGLLAVFFAAAVISICTGADVPEKDRIHIITRLTGKLISEQHYSRHPLDAKKSAMIFDEYFKLLDPNKMYFTEKDVQTFAPHRETLDREISEGNADFAYAVFSRFVKRFDEYCAFAEKELKRKIDFSSDETFVADRRKLPRPADDAALHALWRAKLKNDLLYFRLVKRAMDRDLQERKEKDGKKQELFVCRFCAIKAQRKRKWTNPRDAFDAEKAVGA